MVWDRRSSVTTNADKCDCKVVASCSESSQRWGKTGRMAQGTVLQGVTEFRCPFVSFRMLSSITQFSRPGILLNKVVIVDVTGEVSIGGLWDEGQFNRVIAHRLGRVYPA